MGNFALAKKLQRERFGQVYDPTALIERADKAMYHAKRRGRNVVCLYGDDIAMPAGPAEVAE